MRQSETRPQLRIKSTTCTRPQSHKVYRIHVALGHGMENLSRRQTRQFAIDDPNQRQDYVDRRSALDYAARSTCLWSVVGSTHRGPDAFRQTKRSLINRRARLMRATNGRIGARTSKI